ncbi:MAG: DUF4339 domain-containing protein [Ginsengibacter sp.]
MIHYFIRNGKTESGPFTKDQLKNKTLSVETPVWFAGLQEWTTAGEVYELRDIFLGKNSETKSLRKVVSRFFNNLFRNSDNKKNYQLMLSRERKQP